MQPVTLWCLLQTTGPRKLTADQYESFRTLVYSAFMGAAGCDTVNYPEALTIRGGTICFRRRQGTEPEPNGFSVLVFLSLKEGTAGLVRTGVCVDCPGGRVVKFFAPPSKSIHSFLRGMEFGFFFVCAFNFW